MDNNATISSQLSIVNCQLSILKSYFPTLTDAQKQQIDALFDLYSDWNSKINVISRKDIENLYLHHVLHSLGLTSCSRSDRSEKRHFPPLSCRRGKTIIRLCRESCRHAAGRSGKNRP